MKKKIGIIGLWHLGCVLSASWSKLGNRVYGFDYDNNRIKKLQDGIPPIFEPHLSEKIKEGMNKGLLSYSEKIQSLSGCDYIFLCYDTPVGDDDSCNTSILEKSIADISEVAQDDAVIIVSSQSPVRFCSVLRNRLLKRNKTLDLAYSPENLRLGEAIDCYLNPGRIILGTQNEITERKCVELFQQITNEILKMNLESAEMVKHGINSYLSTSIVFANHISDICERNNARIDDVVKGMKSDPRIGKKAYLSPGIGFSGGTLGRDLQVLNEANNKVNGYARLFGIIHKFNNERKLAIVNKIDIILDGLKEKKVGVLGLTYKPGTSTLRRSLPLEIVYLLIENGAQVKAYDPKADYSELCIKPKFEINRSIAEVSTGVDILVLLTEWPDFKDFCWQNILNKMKQNYFFDCKNFLKGSEMKKNGFHYYSIGRGK